MLKYVLRVAFLSTAVIVTVYFCLLGLLATIPAIQNHVFYLHRVSLIWFKDLSVPEQFGFAPYQVNSFHFASEDGERLHAWHILPLGLYRRNHAAIFLENDNSMDHARTQHLDLLKAQPDARVVIYFHGTAGCLASGWRPDGYRAIYAAAPDHIHVLTFDYRGYGLSSGSPSEKGLLQDGIAAVEWVLRVAQIPPSRIVIYGQSLGTAVALAVMQHYASLPGPVYFSGHVLTAPFSDVATLTATYRIGGVIPVLSPLRRMPRLLTFFNSYLINTWLSRDAISQYVRQREASDHAWSYHIQLIHAQDDSEIACEHSNVLFSQAYNATNSARLSSQELEVMKKTTRTDLGHGGWTVDYRTTHGTIKQTMLAYGLHDKLMSYPVTSLAVLEAFQAADSEFMK